MLLTFLVLGIGTLGIFLDTPFFIVKFSTKLASHPRIIAIGNY